MKKPKKGMFAPINGLSSPPNYRRGANDMWDRFDKYHKQEMDKIKRSASVEKITKHIEDNFDGLFYDLMWFREGLPSEGLISLRLAIAIHKLIGK